MVYCPRTTALLIVITGLMIMYVDQRTMYKNTFDRVSGTTVSYAELTSKTLVYSLSAFTMAILLATVVICSNYMSLTYTGNHLANVDSSSKFILITSVICTVMAVHIAIFHSLLHAAIYLYTRFRSSPNERISVQFAMLLTYAPRAIITAVYLILCACGAFI